MTDLPIVCALTPSALQVRRDRMLSKLLECAQDYEELPNGYRLRFAATEDTLADIAHTVDAERQCCRFLRFTITVEPDGGPMLLELTGPPGTAAFIAALLDA